MINPLVFLLCCLLGVIIYIVSSTTSPNPTAFWTIAARVTGAYLALQSIALFIVNEIRRFK